MAVQKIHIDEFVALAKQWPVLDVRSPGEFKQAHIPGACSLPLFTDEERKVVGTAYKQQSREAAIKIGLDYFGLKMRKLVEEVEALFITNPAGNTRTVLLHCWRGGMRSAGVAWLLDLYGFKVYTLVGGYKKFRQYVRETFSQPFAFNILGGYTGSGKTIVLHELQQQSAMVIDLEAIAHHKGSAFGAIGLPEQPSQEMFENRLALQLRTALNKLQAQQQAGCIWLEDESQRIGSVNIPADLWHTMRSAQVYFLDIPFEQRLDHLVKEYGQLEKEKMVNAIIRIKKRLGGLETKTAINCLLEEDIKGCFSVLLKYYDKHYLKGLQSRQNLDSVLIKLVTHTTSATTNAALLIQHTPLKQPSTINDEYAG